MKILFITSSLEPKDGWGRYGLDIVSEIAKTNDVMVLCNSVYDGSSLEQYAVLHDPHSIVSPLKLFVSRKKIQDSIDSFQPDVIHFVVESYVVVLPFLKLPSQTKTFLTVHGTYSFIPYVFVRERLKRGIAGMLIKKAYERVTGIISVSSFTKEHLLSQYLLFCKKSFDKKKITVITNGIDPKKFSFETTSRVPGNKKSILFVGAVKRRKGVLEALAVLSYYRDLYGDDFVFTIAGSYKENDVYTKQVLSEVKALGLENVVRMVGMVPDLELKKLYTEADLFLMLSIEDGMSLEGFGLVYLEANTYGVPAIGSINSGARDAISPGVSGYLVDPFDLPDCALKINLVLSGSVKPIDCINWAKEQNIEVKVSQITSLYLKS
jgi:glycosyltransferase involved in cell wall biosynthesis